jgi:hypothetical protein
MTELQLTKMSGKQGFFFIRNNFKGLKIVMKLSVNIKMIYGKCRHYFLFSKQAAGILKNLVL